MNVVCALLLATAVAGRAPAHAQELGVHGSLGESRMTELSAPRGFGAFMRVGAGRSFAARLTYHRHADTSERVGRVCNSYIVLSGCADEAITNETLLHGAVLTAAYRQPLGGLLSVELGGGPSINVVRGVEHTESGRTSDLYRYSTAQPGVLGSLTARLRPVAALPLHLEATAANHVLFLSACPAEGWRYAPYCGTYRVSDVRLGVAYDFTRRRR